MVLPYFPEPLEDEPLYGMVARLHRTLGAPADSPFLRQVFGTEHVIASIDQPRHLQALADRLPPSHGLSAEKLLLDHTAFRFYTRFASESVVLQIRNMMTGPVRSRPGLYGVMASVFVPPRWLRYCPVCVANDIVARGQPHWRLVHQLPGVLVCPAHTVSLVASSIERHPLGAGRRRFLCLETTGIGSDVSSATPVEAAVARACQTQLNDPIRPFPMTIFQQALRTELLGAGWSHASSRLIRTADLAAFLMQHPFARPFLPETLPMSSLETALNRLLYATNVGKHPLLVVLVTQACVIDLVALLAHTIAEGESQHPSRALPVGAATGQTLPCGNPLCQRYAEDLGAQLAVRSDTAPVYGGCSLCGFRYRRSPRSRTGFAMMEPGPLWRQELVRLLANEALSARKIARQLGVSHSTVQRLADEMGIWRAEWHRRPKVTAHRTLRQQALAENAKKTWIEFRYQHPFVKSKQFPPKVRSAYRFLSHNHSEWLAANSPLRRYYATIR